MIPVAAITNWSRVAPWLSPDLVEQDLVLSRLICEIAGHPLLGTELVFRGGTCLHKLHLPSWTSSPGKPVSGHTVPPSW